MISTPWVRRWLVLSAGFAGLAAFDGSAGGIMVASAEAKGFYTKKRVNGVWIEGRFPKPGGAARSRGRRVPAVEVTASLPKPPIADRGPKAGGPADPALAAAGSAGNASVASPSDGKPAGTGEERLSKLQKALEMRAQAIATAAPAGAAEPSRAAEKPRGEPRAVSFDFTTGLKTTTFADRSVVKEPFDVASSRALASPPPAPASLGAPASPAGTTDLSQGAEKPGRTRRGRS